MKIVVVGNGGREAALQNRLSDEGHEVVVTPGRGGIPGSTGTPPEELAADLFVIGPEVPLVEGLAGTLRTQGKLVFGPGKNDARLEGSKVWMKQLLDMAGVKTAQWNTFQPGQEEDAITYIDSVLDTEGKVVIKTDYLAAGKGVLVTDDLDEAAADVLAKLASGAIVIEQALDGREVSFFAVCSGHSWMLLPQARDYKRVGEGDTGPNTGGMGTFSPVSDGPTVAELAPIIDGVLSELDDFRGVLFGGLMLTDDGPYVLEFNIRFGDPEIQSITPLLECDLGQLLADAAAGKTLPNSEVRSYDACVTVVLAAEGYPTQVVLGNVIEGIKDAEAIDGVTVHHAGTMKTDNGDFVVAGGRVLNIVGHGRDISEARARAYQAAYCISWPGMQFRTDIAKYA